VVILLATEFTIINKTIKIPFEIEDIVVEGDTNSKTITFNMPNRFFDGVDLSSKLIRVAYKNAEGKTGYDTAYLNTLNVDSFTFDWTLSSNVSVKSGVVSIWVEFSEENYVWKTKPQTFNVEQSFHVLNNATPLDYSLAEEFYANYVEEIITNINDTDEPILIEGRRILVPVLEDIIVSGDNRSQVISFIMDRYYENVDRAEKVIAVKFINADGHSDRTKVINKIVNDTTITFGWLIDSKVSKKDGYVSFAIEVLGYDENNKFQVWSTIPAQIKVEQGLYVDDTIEEPNPSWYQSFQLEADKKLNELSSNEELRIIQENTRIENENLRIQQENIRELNEIQRIENENLRKFTLEAIEASYAPRLTTVENTLSDVVSKVDLVTIEMQSGLYVHSKVTDDCFAELKIAGATSITPANPDLEISPDNIATIKNAVDFDVLTIGKNWFNIYDCKPGANLTLFDGIFTTAPLGNYGGFSIDTVYSTQLGVNLGISNQSILAGSYTISFKLRLKSGSYNKGLNKITIWDGNGAQASVIINSNPAISSSFQTYIGSFALDKRFENYGITFQIQTTDSTDVVLEMIDLQIEKGNVTSYEPYKSNKFHIGFELAEGDILEYIGDNKAKLIKKKERVVLDGSDDENWTFLNDNTDYVEYRLPYSMGTTGTLSNINSHFPNTTNSRISLVSNAIYLRFPKNIENYPTDVASLKASLQTSPVTIQYNLATTIETIIELQPIETYKGVTNIYTTADVQPTITAKFKSRLANAVEVLLSETSKLKQAVISLGGTL